MTPLPLEAFLMSSRNSVFSSTGLQHDAWLGQIVLHMQVHHVHTLCESDGRQLMHQKRQHEVKLLRDSVRHECYSPKIFLEVWF